MDFDTNNSTDAFYAIKDVSEMTGVNAVTLRAWQRRYGLLNPMRTEKGHRLYSQDDINKIHTILGWLEKGVAIGKVRPLLDGDNALELVEQQAGSDSQQAAESLLSALHRLDANTLDKQLNLIMKEYPLELFEKQIAHLVEQTVNSAENPLANVQVTLWHSMLRERCLSLVAGHRKRNKKPCLLLSFDAVPAYRVWLKAAQLANSGYNVTLLTSLTGKLTPLVALMKTWDSRDVFIDGDNKLDRQTVSQLKQLVAESECTLQLSGSITSIHPEIREWHDEPT